MNACTIIAKNYVGYARVLARSFSTHHPGATFSVLVVDDFDGYLDPAAEPFELLTPDEIGCDPFEEMAWRYDVLELSTAVKPWLLSYLLRRGGDTITYLDPDIRVFSSLAALDELGREHGLVLTPHSTTPIPVDGETPSQIDIMVAGVFNLGYLTLGQGAEPERLLDWWSERLLRDCRVDPVYGYFVDQRWMDLVPGLVSDYAVVRDPEFNVAYWNLHERDLRCGDEGYIVNGRPLAFFHFSGFDSSKRHVLSKHQTRTRPGEHPALARILGEYAEALEAEGHSTAREWPYGFGVLPDGTPFSSLLRRLYARANEARELTESPLTEHGYASFVEWLRGQAPDQPTGISRVAAGLYAHREDLPRMFPDLAAADRDRYLDWVRETGIAEMRLPDSLSPSSRHAADRPIQPRTVGSAVPVEPLHGVNVVGYFRSELGLGEAARQVVSALDTVGVPLLPLHGQTVPLSRQRHAFTHLAPRDARFPISLICMNADALPEFARQTGPEFFEGRYSIGLWFWEVAVPPPDRWRDAFAVLDEVWAPSSHVARVVASVADVPVIQIPLPIEVPPPLAMSRGALALPEDRFLFLFSFDFRSVFARKNPLALVDAFTSAFEAGSGPLLVIKCINGDADPGHAAQLRDAVAGREDIRLIEHYLDPHVKDALTAGCDCYVSLHRSEGFGLTMAEAMYLGKPVIATGYGGNADFMTDQNSFLVDYALVPIGPDAAPYPAEGMWAQPSVEHAARLMRDAFEHPEGARERGTRAASDIRESHSPEASGQQMASRLEHVHERAVSEGRRAFTASSRPIRAVSDHLARGPKPRRPDSRTRALANRALLRAMQPFTAFQSQVNRELVAEVARLDHAGALAQATGLRDARLSRLQTEHAHELGYRLARMEALRAPIVERLDGLSAGVQRLEAETHAIPYMQDPPFSVREDTLAGKVLGYSVDTRRSGVPAEYRSFEDVFRGSEEMIRDRQRRYLPIIGDRGPVLDFGCGRGELLDLLREAGTEYLAVDSDASMVARCQEKGHDAVVHADGLEFLQRQPAHSLGAVFSAQVIEHMTEDQIRRLLELARSRLAPGGQLILETVNPHSPPALKAFWVDLTHQQPIFPEVALEFCREAGYPSAYVFHPNGTGDVVRDRFEQGEYAVVATAGEGQARPAQERDETVMATSRTPRADNGSA